MQGVDSPSALAPATILPIQPWALAVFNAGPRMWGQICRARARARRTSTGSPANVSACSPANCDFHHNNRAAQSIGNGVFSVRPCGGETSFGMAQEYRDPVRLTSGVSPAPAAQVSDAGIFDPDGAEGRGRVVMDSRG